MKTEETAGICDNKILCIVMFSSDIMIQRNKLSHIYGNKEADKNNPDVLVAYQHYLSKSLTMVTDFRFKHVQKDVT